MTEQQFRQKCEFHRRHIGIYAGLRYTSDENRHREALTKLHAQYPRFTETDD